MLSMLDVYENCSLSRSSRQMIEFMRKHLLMPTLDREWNVMKFDGKLRLLAKTNFKRLSKDWPSLSK